VYIKRSAKAALRFLQYDVKKVRPTKAIWQLIVVSSDNEVRPKSAFTFAAPVLG